MTTSDDTTPQSRSPRPQAPGGASVVARHQGGRPASTGAWAALAKFVGIAVIVALVSGASLAGIEAYKLAKAVGDGSIDISNGDKNASLPSIAAIDGAFNVLLVGADNAPGQKSFGAARQGTLNDVNILVHIAADHKSGIVMSFPRDTVIPHPECVDPTTGETYSAMSAEPLNTAYSRGGLGCVVATIKNLTGISIPYAALFSFEGTVKMADAVGGVPVCVTKAINDTDSGLVLPAGRSVVTGRTALAYLRDRHGVGDGSDLARIASQQAYMSSLLRVMTSRGTLTNPLKLYSLATATVNNVELSKSMADPDTLVTMALALKGLNLSHMVFVQYPTGADPENPNKVIPSPALAAEVVHRITADLPIGLDKDSLGTNAALEKSKSSGASASSSASSGASATPSGAASKSSSSDVIAGLRGQTAVQQTCSVAASDSN